MRRTLKVLSALMAYPTPSLQAAIPELRQALDAEGMLPAKQRDRLDRIMSEIESDDIYALQERYVLLFDRTKTLSLHLFEHIHGESRDRGQAMVDLASLYDRNGFAIATSELPDYIPLFLEFTSLLPIEDAQELIRDTSHILETIRLRLKKQKATYTSVFSAVMALSDAKVPAALAASLAAEPLDDPNDLAALDADWIDQEVRFGPDAACGKDELAMKLRAVRRPAPGVEIAAPRQPIITTNAATRI